MEIQDWSLAAPVIRAAMRSKGLTQTQIAEQLSLSQSRVSQWFSPQQPDTPSIEGFLQLLEITQVSMAETGVQIPGLRHSLRPGEDFYLLSCRTCELSFVAIGVTTDIDRNEQRLLQSLARFEPSLALVVESKRAGLAILLESVLEAELSHDQLKSIDPFGPKCFAVQCRYAAQRIRELAEPFECADHCDIYGYDEVIYPDLYGTGPQPM